MHGENRTDRRNVLIKTFAELVTAQQQSIVSHWNQDGLDELARLQRIFHVVEIQILERYFALQLTPTQAQASTHRNQRGHRVANRRAVGDITDQSAGVTHRYRGEAPKHFSELGVVPDDFIKRIGQGYRSPDFYGAGINLYLFEVADVTKIDQARQFAQLLGDPQADVGTSGKNIRLRILQIEFSQFVDRSR